MFIFLLPYSGDMIVAVPYKIAGGSGGPTRAFAIPSATYRARVDVGSNRANAAPGSMQSLTPGLVMGMAIVLMVATVNPWLAH